MPDCWATGRTNKELEVLSGDCTPKDFTSTGGDPLDARRAEREVSVVCCTDLPWPIP
jgi:hypothetical protein